MFEKEFGSTWNCCTYIIYFGMYMVPFYGVKKWLLFHYDHVIINECHCICMLSYVTRCVWVKGNVKIWKWIIYTAIVKCCLSIDLLISECVMLLCTCMNAWITFWNILWNTHCFAIEPLPWKPWNIMHYSFLFIIPRFSFSRNFLFWKSKNNLVGTIL